ncbi:hypothetical protein [Comamonas terrae]|uniref:50S ribosomal protein L44e n=1 Tax=Comamonas terrae TaxID=673548 RepID=A0ABW5URY7_9BURK|nr:hypothetical protein [Comamonas terrae]
MTCPTGKQQLTAELAKKRAKRSSASHSKPMTAYRCNECGEWHLGQPAPRKRRIPIIKPNHSMRLSK